MSTPLIGCITSQIITYYFKSLYITLRCQDFSCFYEAHTGTRTQLEGLPWPVVDKLQELPPKITQDRKWTKDTNTQSLHIILQLEPGTYPSAENSIITEPSDQSGLITNNYNL